VKKTGKKREAKNKVKGSSALGQKSKKKKGEFYESFIPEGDTRVRLWRR